MENLSGNEYSKKNNNNNNNMQNNWGKQRTADLKVDTSFSKKP